MRPRGTIGVFSIINKVDVGGHWQHLFYKEKIFILYKKNELFGRKLVYKEHNLRGPPLSI